MLYVHPIDKTTGMQVQLIQRISGCLHAGAPTDAHTRWYGYMPIEEEETLRQEAQEKFPGDKERQDAYVFGALRKMGWKPHRHFKSKRKKHGINPQ